MVQIGDLNGDRHLYMVVSNSFDYTVSGTLMRYAPPSMSRQIVKRFNMRRLLCIH